MVHEPLPHTQRGNRRTTLHGQDVSSLDLECGVGRLLDVVEGLKDNTIKQDVRLQTETEEPPTSIIQNKVVASTRLLIGGAGEDSSIFSIAISIGAKHNIQLKSGIQQG